jgi:uncharacterized protein (TIGR02145 family)
MSIALNTNNKLLFNTDTPINNVLNVYNEFVKDIDDNVYPIVTINNQQWLASNLRVTKYADGTSIPNISNYNDWYLPSKDELNQMYINLHLFGEGEFLNVDYITSTQSSGSDNAAWYQQFDTGTQTIYDKASPEYFRACRSFTGGSETYSLRDIGPAGGLIFCITGTTYYEAAPIDSGPEKWCNDEIRSINIVAAQGTAIGTGQVNTTAIIGQSGHTMSAALVCDSLTSNGLWSGDTAGAYCWYNNTRNGASDWFLPSANEVQAMHDNLYLFGLGNFDLDDVYWTSTENDATTTKAHSFLNNTTLNYGKGNITGFKYRPVRSFVAEEGAYSLRDIGPSGGLIFYISGGTIYYECSLNDIGVYVAWSNITGTSVGTTSSSIGEGQNNTNEIIAQSGHTTSAAQLCNDLSTTGYKNPYGALYNWHAVNKKYDDWFLPSKDELNQMYVNLYLFDVGDFVDDNYWSSSETGTTLSWNQRFTDGSQTYYYKYANDRAVRACRSFTAALNAYSLRDTGPAGGLIFYVTGTTYYEAAPSDQSEGIVWSNITGTSVGTTYTEIGFGKMNTINIITQSGASSGAAFTCHDLKGNQKLIYFTKNGIYDSGWSAATQSDFSTLITNAGGDTVAGGRLKEVGTLHWTTPNTGAVNAYRFKLVPSGARGPTTGTFGSIGTYSWLWADTEYNTTDAYYFQAAYNSTSGTINGYDKKNNGLAIRCVKNIS